MIPSPTPHWLDRWLWFLIIALMLILTVAGLVYLSSGPQVPAAQRVRESGVQP